MLLAKGSLTDLPSFEKLSFLQLGGDVTGEILMALLLKTPYLKTLIFQVGSLTNLNDQLRAN